MSRTIKDVIKTISEKDGADIILKKSIGLTSAKYRNFDPFLMLDSYSIPPTSKGFPPHRHRGIATVNYIFPWSGGNFVHEDFLGHHGVLGPGEVQWMSAGKGIIHSEVPDATAKGLLEGLQLWISLPKKNKLDEPTYQEFRDHEIVKVEKDGVHAHVIAGPAFGTVAKTITTVPIHYVHYSIPQGKLVSHELPQSMNVLVFIMKGKVTFPHTEVTDGTNNTNTHTEQNVIIFDQNGTSVDMIADENAEIVLIAGEPLNEEIARLGPIVMNTEEEIEQAAKDYESATNGFEPRFTYKWRGAEEIVKEHQEKMNKQ